MHCSPWCVSRGPWSATGSHSSHRPDCGIFPGPQLLSPVYLLVVCTSQMCWGKPSFTVTLTPSRSLVLENNCLHCSMTKKIHCVFRKQRGPAQGAQASSHRKHDGLWMSSRTPTKFSTSFRSRPPKSTWFANINYAHAHAVYTRLFFLHPPKSLGTRLPKLHICGLEAKLFTLVAKRTRVHSSV